MKHSFRLSLMTLMLSIPLAGCLHGGSSITTTGANNPAADTMPPTVRTTTPANNTAVDILPTLSATFSEAMDATTINATTFTLTGPSGLVPATVSIDNSRSTATLSPLLSLAILTQYTATITTGAKDSAGNPITADYTWSFTTRDRQWQTANQIENNNNGGASALHLSNKVGDKVFAIWSQSDGTRNNIYAGRYTSTGGWGAVTRISDASGPATNPRIVVDINGNAIAVWQQHDGMRYNIWANRYTSGSGWSTAALIETSDGNAGYPQVAVDANGNAIAVWPQWNTTTNTGNSTYANRYTAGNWGTTPDVISSGSGSTSNPQITMDANSNAIAVWQQGGNIYANRYTANAWGSAGLISATGVNAQAPQIAIDNSGNAIAVWQQSNGIYANRYSGTWGTASTINSNSSVTNPQLQIAMNANGNAVAVWEQSGGIWTNRYTISPANTWGTAAQIPGNAGTAFYPHITMNATGDALVIWHQTDNKIYANRYTSGNWDITATAVATNTGTGPYTPHISMDDSGNAIAAWIQNNGTRDSVWSSRFE